MCLLLRGVQGLTFTFNKASGVLKVHGTFTMFR